MGCGDSKPAPAPGLRVNLGDGTAAPQYVSFKTVMMGDKSTGKSSIVAQYTKGAFTGVSQATIGASFASKDVRTADGTQARLQIWDTAGEEMYRAMTRSFFRDAAAGVIVYDITSTSSFKNVRTWLSEFRDVCPDSLVILVGNKCDRDDDRRVTKAEGANFAEAEGIPFFEVSAKTGVLINDVFQAVAQSMVDRKRVKGGH